LISVFALTITTTAFAQTPNPTDALTYVEHPEGGSLQKSGRTIHGAPNFRHGVDINSTIDIQLDSTKLQAMFAGSADATLTAQAKALLARMQQLEQALANTEKVAARARQIVEAFNTADVATVQQLVKQHGAVEHPLLQSLLELTRLDLIESGTPAEEADRKAKLQLEPWLRGAIDWKAIHDLLRRRLMDVQTEFAATTPDLGIQLEIQAHHVTSDGVAHPVPLPGYNTVAPGPESHYDKVRFEVPTDQLQLYDEFAKVQKTTSGAKSAGEAVLSLLQQDFDSSLAKKQLDALSAKYQDAKSKFETLAAWRDQARLKKWTDEGLEKIKTNLKTPRTAADSELVADWSDAQSKIAPLLESADAVRSLADLGKTTAGKSASDALQSILEGLKALGFANPSSSIAKSLNPNFWQDVAASVTKLRQDVQDGSVSTVVKQALDGDTGPFAAFIALEDAITLTDSTVLSLRELFKANDLAVNVATLPIPQGQTRRDIGKQLDTSINLQTLLEPRNPNDQILISYRCYKGEKQLESPAWSDRFVLGLFGWSDRVIASLGMTNRQPESTCKPTAAISWILSRVPWPKKSDDDLAGRSIRWFGGAGLTTMALSFDPQQSVEVGLAATLSLISDHILIGYGKDLQVSKHSGFFFFSIRVFSRSGVIGMQ
jgi:hypothetical protein